MKKLILSALVLCGAAMMTSCYNTRLLVGNVTADEPVVEVNEKWNDHFIGGLVPGKSAKINPAAYVDNNADYVIRTYTSFVNGLVGVVTCGIYTPTQTKFYLPLRSVEKKSTDKK